MTQKIRGIIFWLMVISFLIVSPIAILYALGYSYDWQNKKLVQNGAFYFQSEPKNASIFINGKLKKTTPRLIKRMTPRTYNVEIKKDGFYLWKKELIIESRLVTEVKDILLINQNPRLETSAENIRDLEKNSVKRISGDNKEKIKEMADEFNLPAENVINAQFSGDDKKLLWQTENEIWVYWLKNDYTQPYKKTGDKELVTRFAEKINQAVWYEKDERHIIFTIGDSVKIIEIDDRDQKNIMDIIVIKNPQIFSKNKILYILSENILYKLKLED